MGMTREDYIQCSVRRSLWRAWERLGEIYTRARFAAARRAGYDMPSAEAEALKHTLEAIEPAMKRAILENEGIDMLPEDALFSGWDTEQKFGALIDARYAGGVHDTENYTYAASV